MITKDPKKSIPILLILVAITLIFITAQAPKVQAWAWNTHYFITEEAEEVFSDNSFFSDHHSTLQTWCVKPDQGWGERDWHWLDAVSYHPLETTGGKLPWAVENVFDNIVQNLKDENWNKAAELMGAISHYTQDATMPLHATYDYNPGYNHVSYEHEVDRHLDEISIPEYVPQEFDNIFEATMSVLEESYGFTGYTENKLSYWLIQDILWNDTIRDITENRLRAGVQFTANLWYTAMIRAGLTIQTPTLTSPSDGTTTTDNTPTFTWTPANGTSFYDFQLASDNNFTTNVITIKDLSTTSYTLENSLALGNWYWRVRSGDNSTHVGLWPQPQRFTVENFFENILPFQPYTSSFNILLESESRDLGELTGELKVTKPSEDIVNTTLWIAFSSRGSSQDNIILQLSSGMLLTEWETSLPPPAPTNQVTLTDGENIFCFDEDHNIENLETPMLTFWFVIGNIQVNSEEGTWVRSENWTTENGVPPEDWITPLYEHSSVIGWDLDELSGQTENRALTVTLEEITVPARSESNWPIIAGIVAIIVVVGAVVALLRKH